MEITHFSHEHPLVLSEEKLNKHFLCGGCCEPIFGVSYCCLVCPYVLHQYCADVPRELPPHEYHPDHPLILRLSPKTISRCKSCGMTISSSCFVYSCNDECSFDLHFYCALIQNETLFNIAGQNIVLDLYTEKNPGSRQCSLCLNSTARTFLKFSNEDNVMDNTYYHFQCAMLPQIVKHDRHRHEFTLRPPLKEKEKYEEFICDLCEEERNPDDHVYYCEPCELVGHIGCGVSGLDRPVQDVPSKPLYKLLEPEEVQEKPDTPKYQFGSNEEGETIEDGGDLQFVQTVYCFMKHPMVITNFTRTLREACAACKLFISGITYSCNECNFHIHKRCTELPKEIHHSHLGSLKLLFGAEIDCLICGSKETTFRLFYGC